MKRSITVLVACATMLAGCITIAPDATPGASEDQSPEVPVTGVGPTGAGATVAPGGGGGTAGGGGESASADLFGSRDVPPGNVAAFLEFESGGGGPGPCPGDPDLIPPEQGVTFYFDTFVVPTSFCVSGLTAGEPAQMSLIGPGATSWRTELVVGEFGLVEWLFEDVPRPVEGEYLFRVSQGELQREELFVVELDGISAGIAPHLIRRRSNAHLVIAGGEAGREVTAHLYEYRAPRGGEDGWFYIANVGALRLDAIGEARMRLRARRNDPLNDYTLRVDPTGVDLRVRFSIIPRSGVRPPPTDDPEAGGEESPPGEGESPPTGESATPVVGSPGSN